MPKRCATIFEIQFIAPHNTRGAFGGTGSQIVRGSKSGTYNIYGDFPEYTRIATKKIFNGGRFINKSDIDGARKVCVIGERTQKELFEEDEDPIGQYVRIDDIYFQVIGVHKYIPGGGLKVTAMFSFLLLHLENSTIREIMCNGSSRLR